jgi:hypothetical protein
MRLVERAAIRLIAFAGNLWHIMACRAGPNKAVILDRRRHDDGSHPSSTGA